MRRLLHWIVLVFVSGVVLTLGAAAFFAVTMDVSGPVKSESVWVPANAEIWPFEAKVSQVETLEEFRGAIGSGEQVSVFYRSSPNYRDASVEYLHRKDDGTFNSYVLDDIPAPQETFPRSMFTFWYAEFDEEHNNFTWTAEKFVLGIGITVFFGSMFGAVLLLFIFSGFPTKTNPTKPVPSTAPGPC